jgi:hyperosmotically inducible periplasmic protein
MTKVRIWTLAVVMSVGSALGGAWADDTNQARSDQPVTDSYITGKVKSELAMDKATNSRDIQVTTRGGVVTLSGSVGSMTEKLQAGSDAQKVKGVVTVQNELLLK